MDIDLSNIEIHFEISWIVVNIASCESEFVQNNILNDYLKTYINKLLKSEQSRLIDNVLHAVANLAGDSKTIHFVFTTDVWSFINEHLEKETVKIKVL